MTRLFSTLLLLLSLAPHHAAGEEPPRHPRHGHALLGTLKYPPNFPHFDYVNPHAPKGGRVRIASIGGFDSLNPFLIKGRSAVGLGLLYDTLMVSALDEPSSAYGLIAHAISFPPDHSHVVFKLRPEARFHDGSPIEPEDVIWSLKTLKQAHPFYRAYYADILRGEKTGPHEVRFVFAVKGNRELPHIAGQIPVLPRRYWRDRDFFSTSLNPPLGSGPYRIRTLKAGRFIEYERVKNYWGQNLSVNRGRHNFDRIRYDYFGDDGVAFEAFKARDIDFRPENTASLWARGYPPALKKRGLAREEVPNKNAQGMQAFVFNTRRSPFDDPLVREAVAAAFDFEWLNKTLFFGQYTRTQSYFAGSDLAQRGLPSPAERALLSPHKDALPPFIFEQPFRLSKTDGSGRNRAGLLKARDLLRQAGWRVKNGLLVHSQTQQEMKIEFLLVSPAFERIVLPFINTLKRLGIQASLRLVDSAQYTNRLREYAFDVVVHTFGQSLSPGNEQRDFFGSQSAKTPGGRNLAGIKSPIVDELIENIILAPDRDALIAASRALDRVLLWGHYVIPQWHIARHRIAFWPPLAHPAPLPPYGTGFPAIWWQHAP